MKSRIHSSPRTGFRATVQCLLSLDDSESFKNYLPHLSQTITLLFERCFHRDNDAGLDARTRLAVQQRMSSQPLSRETLQVTLFTAFAAVREELLHSGFD